MSGVGVGPGVPGPARHRGPTVVVAGDVLVGHQVRLDALGGVHPEYVAAAGAGRLAGAGAGACLGALGAVGVLGALGVVEGGARPAVRVTLLAGVGDDEPGRRCSRLLADSGVDIAHISVRYSVATGMLLSVPRDGATLRVTVPCGAGLGVGPGAGGRPGAGLESGLKSGLESSLESSLAAGLAAVASCRPGDALLVHSLTLPAVTDLVDAAYERDVQLVADLSPFPRVGVDGEVVGGVDPAVLARFDVAVVDPEGAGLLAESGALPGSVLALGSLGGALGASWDDLVRELPQALEAAGEPYDRWERPDLDAPWPRHAFCGALAGALAAGADRPEALDAALVAWWRERGGAGPGLAEAAADDVRGVR